MELNTNLPIIQATIAFVQKALATAEGGHDWFHIERVYKTALKIASQEQVDQQIVALAALLHDIADPKFNDGDETIGPKITREFLTAQHVDSKTIDHVEKIVQHMSFKNSLEPQSFNSLEMQVVQDADRLDAIGAIGIARCFNYGGYKNRPLYDPDIAPVTHLSKEAYKNSKGPTINHFYEKLLKLKEGMHTKTCRQMAAGRHEFMVNFLSQFYREWEGEL